MTDEEIMRAALMEIAFEVDEDLAPAMAKAAFWKAMCDEQRGIAQDALDAIAKRS